MKGLVGFLILCSCLAGLAYAQEATTPPPARRIGNVPNVLLVGPKDSLAVAKRISGKTRLIPAFPSSVKAAEVEFFVDDKSAGKASAKPFRLDLDTSTITTGEHLVKAVARDSAGKELWSATCKANAQPSDASGGAPTTVPAVDPVPVPEEPTVENPVTPPAENGGSGPSPTAAIPSSLDRSYVNNEYAISVKYSSVWSVRDDSKIMADGQPCAFWLVFGSDPLVINIHAQKLAPGTDAARFVRYNKYVESWNRKKVWNKNAFSLTTGSPQDKSVVHRLIVIENGRALMINCIDKTGRPAAESAKLFDKLVSSMKSLAH